MFPSKMSKMKKKMADGGQIIGGPLKEMKAMRPNPYTGNEPEADDIEADSEGAKFAKGGPVGKKGAVLAIVAKLAKKPSKMGEAMAEGDHGAELGGHEAEETPEEMHEEDMAHEAKMAAGEEIISAFKSGDVEALVEALANFHTAMR